MFLYKGKKSQLKASVGSLRAGKTVTWSSSDPGIAAVSSDGTVTAKSTGSAVITATASTTENSMSAHCKVKVGPEKLVDISKLTGAYQAQDYDVLTGKGNADTHITVADGAAVTLRNCDITAISNDTSHSWSGITLEGNGTILLEGTNKVRGGFKNYSGIYVPEKKTLTINGSGSLGVSSNGSGAGIGGGFNNKSCGNITISGGDITATGGRFSAGIGSGYSNSSCKNINITKGIIQVKAIKGEYADNSVGAGNSGSCGTITIGGKVTDKITQSPYYIHF
ncbi:MAG: Ig-like domain-containing protein [Clostridia bacterium]|nr:Ig-like domain-containing protein [Clostridia bacterium]